MGQKEKIVKQFLYEGLGFPVIIENVLMRKIRGEWTPHFNVKLIANAIFKELPNKPSKLTGNEIKFIRTYLEKSKPAFGELFALSHTAVSKWEKSGDKPAPISPSQEIVLRLFIEDYLGVGVRKFYKTFKEINEYVHKEEDTPLKIAT